MTRRFPRPWDIEEINKAAFVVRDNNGAALANVYFEDEPGRRAAANLSPATRRGALLLEFAGCPSYCALSNRTQMRWFTGDREASAPAFDPMQQFLSGIGLVYNRTTEGVQENVRAAG
jgi:hypothetical protein